MQSSYYEVYANKGGIMSDNSTMITSTQGLADYLNDLGQDFCAMDTEADSLHRYSERLCLIQYTDGEKHQLIDPLEIESMQPLVDVLKDAKIWMHGADYDMMLMRKEFDSLPAMIYDTQIAARLIGAQRFGYANLVEDYLGVELDKGSQKADWAKRPLTDIMVDYALNDVRYLKPLAETLLKGLHEKGRYEWFIESCENAMQRVQDRPQGRGDDPWRIKGAGRLQPKGLAYLRALWHWRDDEAREWDRPCFMVCGNKQLISWVEELVNGKKPKLPKHFRTKRVKNFFKVVDDAAKLPESEYPQKPKGLRRKKDPEFDDKVDAYVAKRNALAEELEIDGSLIISRATIEALVMETTTPEESLMKWQRELLEV